MTNIESVTRAIASINPIGTYSKPYIPVMELSAKGIRRRLARQPAMHPTVQTKRQARRVSLKVVAEVVKKRLPHTRAAAIQSYVDFGILRRRADPKPPSAPGSSPSRRRAPASVPTLSTESDSGVPGIAAE